MPNYEYFIKYFYYPNNINGTKGGVVISAPTVKEAVEKLKKQENVVDGDDETKIGDFWKFGLIDIKKL